MGSKVVFSLEQIKSIVGRLNNKEVTLDDVSSEHGISKKTLGRKIKEFGWNYDRNANLYVFDENIAIQKEKDNCNIVNNVPVKNVSIVNRTYGIPQDIDRALKIKSAIEGERVIDIVREALKKAIEDKYFDM